MGNEENKAPMAEKIDLTPVEVDPSLSDEAEFGKPDNDSKSYGMFLKAFSIIAALLALFHLYTAQFGILTGVRQRAVHLTIVLVLTFMIKPANRKKQRTNLPPFYDFIFMLGAIVSGAYMYIMDAELSQRSGTIYTIDVVMGVILILLILEACRRLMGWALPIVALVMIVYAFFGQYFPGLIAHPGYSLRRIIGYLFLGTEGVFGTALNMSSTVIAIFIIFGSFLKYTGTGDFVTDFSVAAFGRVRGGPAKVAVIASTLFGSLSGSAVANVVATGSFTIPLMKRIGYEPEFAAAVEACSSTGGQIVPPVMGTAAFLMADYIGMPYKYIMLAAILPCILYYFSIFVAVHLRAKRKGLRGLEKSECPDVKKALKERGHLILPFVLVIYMICAGYSAVHSGFWGIVSTVAVAQLRKTTRMSFRDIIDALISGAKRSISVAVACACVGFIVGIVSLTGVGNVLGNYILILAGGKLLPTCFLAMLLSILLGMGLPCTGVYIVMATIVAPALVRLNVPIVAAHLFCFYFGIMASITPPVAIAAYAGAGIAQCNPAKAGWISFRIAIPSLMIPYVFVYNSSILLVTGMGVMETVTTLVSATCGIVLMCIAFERYASQYCDKLAAWKAVCVGVGGFMMIVPGILTDILGIAIAAVMIVPTVLVNRRKELASE